jgi:ABC-type antimicrobial peptide transport system permease subunit
LAFYAPKDLVVRAGANPMALAPAVRRIIHEADADQAISDVQSLEYLVAAQIATPRAQLRVLGGFAGIALLLAAIGIHGLVSFWASSRTREVGVRIALGAGQRDILNMFLRQGLLLGAGGVAVGAPLAFLVGRAITPLLFGVDPGDPATYASAALLALTTALAGSLRPAIRAAGVDRAISIRAE